MPDISGFHPAPYGARLAALPFSTDPLVGCRFLQPPTHRYLQVCTLSPLPALQMARNHNGKADNALRLRKRRNADFFDKVSCRVLTSWHVPKNYVSSQPPWTTPRDETAMDDDGCLRMVTIGVDCVSRGQLPPADLRGLGLSGYAKRELSDGISCGFGVKCVAAVDMGWPDCHVGRGVRRDLIGCAAVP